jgi:hypothetical protein
MKQSILTSCVLPEQSVRDSKESIAKHDEQCLWLCCESYGRAPHTQTYRQGLHAGVIDLCDDMMVVIEVREYADVYGMIRWAMVQGGNWWKLVEIGNWKLETKRNGTERNGAPDCPSHQNTE